MKKLLKYVLLFLLISGFVFLDFHYNENSVFVEAACNCTNCRNSHRRRTCTPRCGDCTPPACPADTNSVDRGSICFHSTRSCSRGTNGCGGSCGSRSRTCWWLEDAPKPTTPTRIDFRGNGVSCEIKDDVRIPFPSILIPTDGFVGRGSVSRRKEVPNPTCENQTLILNSENVELLESWTGFVESADKSGGEIYYQISNNGGQSWFYWNNGAWRIAGSSNYNTAAVVSYRIGSFPIGSGALMVKAFLRPGAHCIPVQQGVDLFSVSLRYRNIANGENCDYECLCEWSCPEDSPGGCEDPGCFCPSELLPGTSNHPSCVLCEETWDCPGLIGEIVLEVTSDGVPAVIGQLPFLRYKYIIQDGLTVLGQSDYIRPPTRYIPSPSLNLQEGKIYDIYVLGNTLNRCSGNTDGDSICRQFKVNHIPRVLSIEPVGNPNDNPNDSVSGNPDRPNGSSQFGCDIDNPKTFKVTFQDLDGCADLHNSYGAPLGVCGGGLTPELSLRAVDIDRGGEQFLLPSSPRRNSLECLPDGRLVAYFDIKFEGGENRNLRIQAQAKDILHDTSDWVDGPSWAYDAIPPSVTALNPHTVLDITSLRLSWGLTDNISNLSGIRGVKIFTKLVKGQVLTSPNDYDDLLYEEELVKRDSLLVENLSGPWTKAWEEVLDNNEAKGKTEWNEDHRVNVGKNQDGFLHFKLETVDRACNYVSIDTLTGRIGEDNIKPVELGAPWIATRGGHIYSGGDIRLAVRNVAYKAILPEEFLPKGLSKDSEGNIIEETTLSTELVSLSGEFKGFQREDNLFYTIPNYSKRLSYPWYDLLLSRAKMLDPNKEQWSEVPSFNQDELQNCRDGRFVYFISGDLDVLPEGTDSYKDLGNEENTNGCIFVVKGDVNIGPGEYQSGSVDPSIAGYQPVYDIIRGYFVSDGVINIEYADDGEDIKVRDGLKIIGGLFATGEVKSVKLGRSFQLRQNLHFPSLIIFHDARYLDIAREVLGGSLGGNYLRDLGLEKL